MDLFSLKAWKRESQNSRDHKLWKGSPVNHRNFKALHWNHHFNPYKNSKLKSAPSEPLKSAPYSPLGVGTFLHIPQSISNWVPCYRILIKQPCFQHEYISLRVALMNYPMCTGLYMLVTGLIAKIWKCHYHTTYSWNIKCQKCEHMGLNGFHINSIIGIHCIWKNQNPGSPFGATS